jgi:hypothetical protein
MSEVETYPRKPDTLGGGGLRIGGTGGGLVQIRADRFPGRARHGALLG